MLVSVLYQEVRGCHSIVNLSLERLSAVLVLAVQATIDSWRLGWNFTAKESIQSASNVYTPGVQTVALDSPNVQLQGSAINDTIKPFSWTEISFLGTKSTLPVPDAQYKASL